MKFLGLLAASFFLASYSYAEWHYKGHVSYVVDGDTFDMRTENGTEHRIRPAGFDTPESGRPCYQEATQALRQMIDGKVVEARCYKFQPSSGKHKRRDVCRVSLDGQDIGIEMIRAGTAWHAKKWAHEQGKHERRLYAEAEYKAMQEGKECLWSTSYPSAD